MNSIFLFLTLLLSFDLFGYPSSMDQEMTITTPLHRAAPMNASWLALGTGLGGLNCNAIAIDQHGFVYAGGYFSLAGGSPANNIAVWDGTSWSTLGAGFNNLIADIAIDKDGNVYAGGNFLTAGGSPANDIAVWIGEVLPAVPPLLEGIYETQVVHLSWAAASETDPYGYHIEYSSDGKAWQNIHFQQDYGLSSTENRYEYKHRDPIVGLNYYRLKQLEQDGTYVYSKTISISVSHQAEINAYLNPTTGRITLTGIKIGHAKLRIIDSLGRLVRSQLLSGQEVDISDLPSGVYYLILRDEQQSRTISIRKI